MSEKKKIDVYLSPMLLEMIKEVKGDVTLDVWIEHKLIEHFTGVDLNA